MADAPPGPSEASAVPPAESGSGSGSGQPASAQTASLLCDVRALTGSGHGPAGALWKLTQSGRQLDANVVHLPGHQRVETHAEPDLDVLLLVIDGHGVLGTAEGTETLEDGALFWLPRGSSRSITAGAEGLSYLIVHRRRPGMQIRSARS